jgi:hypothetical protein
MNLILLYFRERERDIMLDKNLSRVYVWLYKVHFSMIEGKVFTWSYVTIKSPLCTNVWLYKVHFSIIEGKVLTWSCMTVKTHLCAHFYARF